MASPARLRLPSLGTVIESASATGRRFPLVLASGIAAAAAAILASEDLGPASLHAPLLAAATLGLPLFTAVALLGERTALAARVAVSLGALAVLVAVRASWSGWSEPVQVARYAQLSVAFHLGVAFLPFARRQRPIAFWQYNRILLQRFVAAGISSATLFLGLALALAALNKLFGVELERQAYFRVWVLCAFVFNTWFFLGGVPADLDALEESREYPAILRVFAQYTLVPLVTVYLVILTLYFAKVVVSWDWPSGWIGYLVTGVAGAGILALLLVHPLAEQEGERWIAAFARDFWLGILPAVVMLWLAIYQRVHQYGFTEPRYFLGVLSVWLAAIAMYFVVTRSRRILVIPASLCGLAVVTFAGPWGAYTVSRHSQLARVRSLLQAHGVLAGGRVRRAAADLPPADRRALSGAVRYLVETHGSASLAPLLGDSLVAAVTVPAGRSQTAPEERARAIVEALGVNYVYRSERGLGPGQAFTFVADDRPPIWVTGYDALITIRDVATRPQAGDSGLDAVLVRGTRSVRVRRAGRTLLDVPLDSVLSLARTATDRRTTQQPAARMRCDAANAQARAVMFVRSISGYVGSGEPVVTDVQGVVLLRLRPGS